MRIFERLPNGATIDIKTWSIKKAIAAWSAWHAFHGAVPKRPQAGFRQEEQNEPGSN